MVGSKASRAVRRQLPGDDKLRGNRVAGVVWDNFAWALGARAEGFWYAVMWTMRRLGRVWRGCDCFDISSRGIWLCAMLLSGVTMGCRADWREPGEEEWSPRWSCGCGVVAKGVRLVGRRMRT